MKKCVHSSWNAFLHLYIYDCQKQYQVYSWLQQQTRGNSSRILLLPTTTIATTTATAATAATTTTTTTTTTATGLPEVHATAAVLIHIFCHGQFSKIKMHGQISCSIRTKMSSPRDLLRSLSTQRVFLRRKLFVFESAHSCPSYVCSNFRKNSQAVEQSCARCTPRQGAVKGDGRPHGSVPVALARCDYLLLRACDWTTTVAIIGIIPIPHQLYLDTWYQTSPRSTNRGRKFVVTYVLGVKCVLHVKGLVGEIYMTLDRRALLLLMFVKNRNWTGK